MKTLEEEAADYAENVSNLVPGPYIDFIAGANSKWVQAEKIKAQIDILNSFYYGEDLNDEDIMRFYTELHSELTEELQKQLKELEQ